MAVTLESPRLILREMDLADLPFVFDQLSHPKVMAYWPKPLTKDGCVAWIEKQIARYAADGYGYWLAIRKRDNRPIGQAGLMKVNLGTGFHVALGYIIHFPYWRKGYATESSAACIAYAFEHLQKRQVIALVRPENKPSIRVAQKLGMKAGKTVEFGGFSHVIFSISRTAHAKISNLRSQISNFRF